MNVYVQKICKKKDTTGVHGNTMVKDSFVGGVPLEVDDHLMGGPGLAHHLSMERPRGRSSSECGIA